MTVLIVIAALAAILCFWLAWYFSRLPGPKAKDRAGTLRLTGMLLLILALVLFAFREEASAHDFWINHSGYVGIDGTHCCGNNDCFEIDAKLMRSTAAGWLNAETGELVPYSETQASEDQKFWRCKKWDGTRRCFFAPQPSS